MVDFRDLKNSNSHPDKPQETISPETDFEKAEVGSEDIADQGSGGDSTPKDLYKQAVLYVSRAFEAARRKKAIVLEPGYKFVQQLVEGQPNGDTLFVMAIRSENRYPFIFAHCVNTAVFAVKMGAGLGLSKSQQAQIGLAALLHDVGTALIPDDVVNKAGRLTSSEVELFRERPQHSYRILGTIGDSGAYLAEIAQQVYERTDGSGYPLGLQGDEIHEHAQIIGLVDMYEALVHSRPQRENLLHFAAIKEIIKTSKHMFQRKHLKCLLSVFSIFPISSYVRLNSDAVGRVVETYPDQPMRPKLQILYDSQKRKVLTERIVNLNENPLLYIVDSVSEQDMETMEGALVP